METHIESNTKCACVSQIRTHAAELYDPGGEIIPSFIRGTARNQRE
jgi:hypothetical protein